MIKSLLPIAFLGASLLSANDCSCTHCLGPSKPIAINAPAGPITCNGDFTIIATALYWNAHEDGLAYALENDVIGTDSLSGNPQLNNLIEADYFTPNFKWDLGARFGISYTFDCDGWDFGILWTYYRGKAFDHVEAEFDDNRTLIPLWSAYQFPSAGTAPILFASDIETRWRLTLNLVDLEIGRAYWVSQKVTLRPHMGLRLASINQNFSIEHRGGSWNDPGNSIKLSGDVDLKNNYHGLGLISGLDSQWHLGCGWSLTGNLGLGMIYGRFSIDHDENLRNTKAPFSKTSIFEANKNFRSSKPFLDLDLAVQWKALFCDCKYGFSISLGWEHHLFFGQNQLWRAVRNGGINSTDPLPLNSSGETVFHEKEGDLSTQGLTLTALFTF